ncbi:unnamed protein product [Haemonchus placei]|uniref:Mediator of RNA polymerase II transcription subunit 7 n=1 Tax=Haemonchus placei TaxID=6290 RepID=A0A0N4X5F7_HAEPC|nr:unnamed protein product [Haemonchus placei]
MSSGPFEDRTRADSNNEKLYEWLAEDGFSKTLADLLRLLLSLPTHPERPDMCLNDMLKIPQTQTNNEMLMTIVRRAREQLTEEMEENRKMVLRYEQLNEMLSNDIYSDLDEVVQMLNIDTEHRH